MRAIEHVDVTRLQAIAMHELLLRLFRGLQPYQQDRTGTILPMMEQSRGFILRQIPDAGFPYDIGVPVVAETNRRALTGLVV